MRMLRNIGLAMAMALASCFAGSAVAALDHDGVQFSAVNDHSSIGSATASIERAKAVGVNLRERGSVVIGTLSTGPSLEPSTPTSMPGSQGLIGVREYQGERLSQNTTNHNGQSIDFSRHQASTGRTGESDYGLNKTPS